MHSAAQCNTEECRRIRVLVVDEHQAVRHAITALVSTLDDMELAGEASSAKEALCLGTCATPPDVALLGTTVSGNSGAEACRALLCRWPSVRVIGMSTFQEEQHVQAVLDAGAVSYLLKNVSADQLAGAIRLAYAWHEPSGLA